MRLEFRTEKSNRFWESKMLEYSLVVCFGKIETDGQMHSKEYPSSTDVLAECRRRVCKMLAKGYKPTLKTVVELLDNAPPIEAPAAIASLCISYHHDVSGEIAHDICNWMTACICYAMMPKQFASIWNKLLEGNEELNEALGKSSVKVPDGESPFWLDKTDWSEGGLDAFYAEAVKNNADRFIWYDSDGYIYIVALRGDPGARAIKAYIPPDEETHQDTKKDSDWLDRSGPGTPISHMSCDIVFFRDGRKPSVIKQ